MNKNFMEQFPEWICTTPEGGIKILSQILYKHLKNDLKLKISDKGNYFLYRNGLYALVSERELKSIIKSHIPVELRKPKDWNTVWLEFCSDKPNVIENDFDSNENLVPFKNGVLELDSGKLVEYNEKMLLTRRINCKYYVDKTLDDAPVFKEYLKTLCNNNTSHMNFLLEYIGAILSNVKGWKFKKLLILVGEGNTGKTQIRELTMDLLGREYCVSIDMKKLNERFATAQLYKKRLAGSGDMSSVEIEEMAIIKNLTGGDSLFAEFKGKNGFSFVYEGLLWFNANSLPYFRGDRGKHVYDRFNIIKCENIIPLEKRDPKLIEKMLTEKDIIASIAIDKLKEVIDRNYELSESIDMLTIRRDYIIENNSLLSFVKECCCDLYSGLTKRSEFNKVYTAWCFVNRVRPERERSIGQQLFEYYQIEAKKRNGYYYYPINIEDAVLLDLDIK